VGHLPGFAQRFFLFECVDPLDGREATHSAMLMHDRL
jgi:hypothetical protein